MAEDEAGQKKVQQWLDRNAQLLSPDEKSSIKRLTGFEAVE
jgi:hypothetical protein